MGVQNRGGEESRGERGATSQRELVIGQALFDLLDLDEIAAGVVEDRHDYLVHIGWLRRELDAARRQFFVFGVDVFDAKGVRGDALFKNTFLVCTGHGVVLNRGRL